MENENWNAVLLGFEPQVHIKDEKRRLINSLDTHAYILSEKGMKYILNFHQQYGIFVPIDVVIWMVPNVYYIDPILFRSITLDINIYIQIRPNLIILDLGFTISDITSGFDYIDIKYIFLF